MSEGVALRDRLGKVNARPRRISLSDTMRLVRSDIAYRCEYERKTLTWRTAVSMLMHPGVGCVARYRFQCFFFACGLAPIGRVLKFINLILYGVQIDERAEIGPGLYMAHAVSILITREARIGKRCKLFHQNTIGLSPFLEPGQEPGPIVIGDDVTFGGGSCAYGNIVVGDGCTIGVNTVVEKSIPAGSTVFGVPGRIVGRTRSGKTAEVE